MLCFLRNTGENETEEAGGRSSPLAQPPAPGPLLWDMSTKMEGPGARSCARSYAIYAIYAIYVIYAIFATYIIYVIYARYVI